jgi:hypothetical protein
MEQKHLHVVERIQVAIKSYEEDGNWGKASCFRQVQIYVAVARQFSAFYVPTLAQFFRLRVNLPITHDHLV